MSDKKNNFEYEEFVESFNPRDDETPLCGIETAIHRGDAYQKATGAQKYVADDQSSNSAW